MDPCGSVWIRGIDEAPPRVSQKPTIWQATRDGLRHSFPQETAEISDDLSSEEFEIPWKLLGIPP